MEERERILDLVNRAIDGDRSAFNQLVHKYHRIIYAYAYKQLGNEENARDVTQEIFINAYCSLSSLRNKDRFLNWLFGLANNICATFFRKLKRNPRVVEASFLEECLAQRDSYHGLSPVEESLERKSLREKVLSVIQELPENYQMPLMLRYLEDMTYADIAEALNLTKGSVVGIIFRGTKYLRVKLKSRFVDVERYHET